MNTGHFTQLVWKGTLKVGMARSRCGNFIFANYFPAGNMQGQFQQNVFPLGTNPPKEQESVEGTKENRKKKRENHKGQGEKVDDWVTNSLVAHNSLRAKHGVGKLVWSQECTDLAQRAADHCTAAGGLQHTNMQGPSGRHGQNGFGGWGGGSFGAKQAVQA